MTDEAPVITEKPLYLRTIPHHNRGHGHGHGGHGARRMSVSYHQIRLHFYTKSDCIVLSVTKQTKYLYAMTTSQRKSGVVLVFDKCLLRDHL